MSRSPKVVVFLGPTMPVAEARALLDASYRPPAIGGDVYACLREEPVAIGLIDGCFDQAPSVRHKEILYALSRGVHVFGAASMGALRAAELHAFGMVGVGRIFEAYRDGVLEDDDEVAVEHAAQEYEFRELSDAMVNIRAGLARAREQGLVSAATEQALAERAKRCFYPERRWPSLLDDAEGTVPGDELERLRSFVRNSRPSQKRDDAVEMLSMLATLLRDGLAPHQPSFEFEATPIWHRTRLSVDRRFE